MNKRWITEKRRDHYYNLAKKQNYRSRAVYKLLQLNKKFRLMKNGDIVIDLGCAPGGWLQATRQIVGEKGLVIGIDLQEVKSFSDKNVFIIKGDMTKEEALEEVVNLLEKRFPKKFKKPDVVLSDASPNISGIWSVDQAKSITLSTTALSIATKMLKRGGNFVTKVFQGELFDEYLKLVSSYFDKVFIEKPSVCRTKSAEVYLVAKNYNQKEFNIDPNSPIAELLLTE